MNNPTPHTPGRKSTAGQSEILIAILFLGLLSGAVIAQNYTNTTMNITGDLLINLTNTTEITIAQTKTIQVFANSQIILTANNTFPDQDDTILITTTLLLDNSTPLQNQPIDFFLDGNLMGSRITNPEGQAHLDLLLSGLVGHHNLSVEFAGDGYVNPSQEQALIHVMETNFSINVKEELGDLQITVFNISEGSYKTFDLDENYERIEQKYYKIYVEVFNNFSRIPGVYTLEDNEVIEVFLEDELGNSYEQDNSARFFLGPSNLFGNSAEITPSNSRKGYMIFSGTRGIPERLIFRIKSEETVEFELT